MPRFLRLRAVKSAARLLQICSTLVFFLRASLGAEDASIDRLLSKLPPPEKLIKPSVQKALQHPDPAFKDPLVAQMAAVIKTRNFSQVLNLSRKLAEKYPRSAGAQCLRGAIAYDLRQFAEASVAFRAATAVEPKFAFGHFGG